MPIYEYACTSCGRSVEVIHGVHAAGPEVCEVCGGRMRKMLTTPSIHFKGSGWAKKDARDTARQRAGTASRDDSTDGAAVTGGTEKPAASGDASAAESGSATKGATGKEASTTSTRADGSKGAAKGGASD